MPAWGQLYLRHEGVVAIAARILQYGIHRSNRIGVVNELLCWLQE